MMRAEVGFSGAKPETQFLGFSLRMEVISIRTWCDWFCCCRLILCIGLLCYVGNVCWAQSDPLLNLNGNGQGNAWERVFL
jgi:hypothetical protein